jgi:hypothetical protein
MMGDPNDIGQAQADLKDNTMVNIEQGEAAGQSLGAGVMDTAAMMKKGMDKATGY